MHNIESDSIAEALRSDTHSSKDNVKAPTIDTRIINDPPIETDVMSNSSHDSKV